MRKQDRGRRLNAGIWLALLGFFCVFEPVIGFERSAQAEDLLRVGVILPLSGQYASIGGDAQKSILLAAEGQQRVQLVFEDSGFDANQAIAAYRKLKTVDHIELLINLDSVSFKALHPLLKTDGMLTLQLAESVRHEVDTVFQLMPSSYPLFSRLGTIASSRYRRISLVYGESDFLQIDADYFKKGAVPERIVFEQALPASPDYRTIVTRLLAEKPDATTFLLNVEEGMKFLRALEEQKAFPAVKLICDVNTTFNILQYLKALGPEIFEGCITTVLPNRRTAEFSARFRKRYGHEPAAFADYAYDALRIAVKLAGVTKGHRIVAMQHLIWHGVSGLIKFDEQGTRVGEAQTEEFRSGRFVRVE